MTQENTNQTLKDEDINDLVPLLIEKLGTYEDNLRDRVKINGIFNEFEFNTRKNFKKFIELSDKRYKRVKSGNFLDRIISNQKPVYEELSNQILSNRFYTNDQIEKEAKKLLKKMNNKDKEIYQLRKEILKKSKNFTNNEVLKRERFASASILRRQEYEKRKNNILVSHLDLIYRPGSQKKKVKKDTNLPVVISDEQKLENEINEFLVKKKYFDDLMQNDCKNLNENIAEYKKYIKEMAKKQKEKEKEKENATKKDKSNEKSFTFLTDGIKLLSYKNDEIIDDKPIKKEEPKIDIIQLMRFTKRGNKKFFLEELKKKSVERIKTFQQRTKSSKKNSSRNNDNNPNELYENLHILSRPISSNNTINNFNNFKNTIKTVKNEAEKGYYLQENFNIKRNTMNNLMDKNAVPKIDLYEDLLKKTEKTNKIKNINDNSYNLYKIFNNDTYHKKLQMCGGGFKTKHRDEKNPQDVLDETKKYLKELNEVKLKANIYNEPKIKKENIVKDCLNIYKKSDIVGRINKEIEEKNNKMKRMVKREKERKKVEELYVRKLKEEIRKKKEEEQNMELAEKIRQNLENDFSQNEDVNLKLKYILSDAVVKKNKDNAYEDYKEFLEIAKQKKANKLYYNNDSVEENKIDQKKFDKNYFNKK